MSVNQQAHTGPLYGQSQPGYAGYMQPAYGGQQMQSASPYGAYNGPASGYQQTGPPQGPLRTPNPSGAPTSTSGSLIPSGQPVCNQFGQGDVQNGIPTTTGSLQRVGSIE